jgi:hypothetical protein
VPGLRGPEVKESASGGPQLPPHSKNESVRPWRLLGGPVCASLRNSLESILGQCSVSAALSPSQASSPSCSSPAKAALIGPLWLFCSRLAASHPSLGRLPWIAPRAPVGGVALAGVPSLGSSTGAAQRASIQNISGLPQGLAGRPAAGWRCGRLSARASRRR